jgi:hypothetical protein
MEDDKNYLSLVEVPDNLTITLSFNKIISNSI